MARERIFSGSKFEDMAGYCRAVADGPWCFVAGTTGFDPVTGDVPADVAEQTLNALANIGAAMEQAGFVLADVVRATYYVTHRDYVPAVMAVVGDAFADVRPVATMIVCELIEPAMKVEIEVTAYRPV